MNRIRNLLALLALLSAPDVFADSEHGRGAGQQNGRGAGKGNSSYGAPEPVTTAALAVGAATAAVAGWRARRKR